MIEKAFGSDARPLEETGARFASYSIVNAALNRPLLDFHIDSDESSRANERTNEEIRLHYPRNPASISDERQPLHRGTFYHRDPRSRG